jgi:hypothetical protein
MIQYDKNYLSLIDSLGVISSKVLIKNGEQLKIFNGNAGSESTLFYELIAPVEKFIFEGKEIAFNNFKEFFQILNCYSAPTLSLKDNKILIKKDKSKFNYVLSDPEQIRLDMEIEFDSHDVSFKVTEADLVEIKKLIGLVRASDKKDSVVWTDLTSKENNLNMVFKTAEHNNSFERECTCETVKDDAKITIVADVFTALPKGNYSGYINNEGIVKFVLEDNEIILNIFVGGKNE